MKVRVWRTDTVCVRPKRVIYWHYLCLTKADQKLEQPFHEKIKNFSHTHIRECLVEEDFSSYLSIPSLFQLEVLDKIN